MVAFRLRECFSFASYVFEVNDRNEAGACVDFEVDSGRCACGGVTARLCDVAGRGRSYLLGGGFSVTSRELDDMLFDVEGLLDYRATLGSGGGREHLVIEFQAGAGHERLERDMERALGRVPGVAAALGIGTLVLGPMRRVEAFSPSHTVKRTISDQRGGRS
jgi:hypothetical protein